MDKLMTAKYQGVATKVCRRYEDMRLQYAAFWASRDTDAYTKTHKFAMEDYDALCKIPGVRMVGISWGEQPCLVIGTDCVDVYCPSDGTIREIGEFTLTIEHTPPSFRFRNVTRVLRDHGRAIAYHPHINAEGVMCMPIGRQEALVAIADCRGSEAVKILLTALWMRAEEVTIGSAFPYARLEYWPIKKSEVSK